MEDRVRFELHDRAATGAPHRPDRVAEVRSRVRAIRRRRLGTATACLIAVLVGGAIAARPSARGQSLPPTVPGPPYFDEGGAPNVRGWENLLDTPTLINGSRQASAGVILDTVPDHGNTVRYLLVVDCENPGVLDITGPTGVRLDLDCRHRVGRSWEGPRGLTYARAVALLGRDKHGLPIGDLRLDTGGVPGTWAFAMLQPARPVSD